MTELDSLLAPIRPDQPCGDDLRQILDDNRLEEAREHRREEDPAFAAVPEEAKAADWRALISTCEGVLNERSKDLELAAYLTEGLTRLQGFPGLLDGLRLVDGLLENFWQGLYPGIEDGEFVPELRAKFLNWLGTSNDFLNAVRSVPLTVRFEDTDGLGMAHFLEARAVEQAARENAAQHRSMVESGMMNRERWEMAFGQTPDGQKAQTRAVVEECLALVNNVAQRCRDLFPAGEDPSFIDLRDLLEEIRDLHAGFSGEGGGEVGGDGMSVDGVPAAAGGASAQAGPIATRQDAVRKLEEVASFLRQTEPHSPVSHLVERCVKWLNMPFEQLIQDIVKSDDVLYNLRETLGLPPQEEGGME